MDSRFILIYFPFRGTRVGASNKQCEFHQIKIVSQVHVLQRCGYGRFLHRRDKLCSRPGTEYKFISPTLWDRQKRLTNLLANYEKQDKKYGFVEFYTMYKNCNRMSENSVFLNTKTFFQNAE